MKVHLIAISALIGAALAASHAYAEDSLQFREVMKELGHNMQTVADGISREDWDLVAKTAPMIAKHPQPPASEKQRIMSFMGPEMPKFKAFDMQTHDAAHELEHAAHEKNGQQVIAAFQKVQMSCLSCHQAFRDRFVAHFYGATR